ncbi:Hypothetical protein, putative [Bodo saltans]|uniref:Uncharacterized protein n=1 Tax=Bodo saltans TaxID=75058 RepID=A0A0S4KGI4_BODSA|nr:Hypothetical protein, putative [Bodo saltans]|eukprot:CUI14726.1 Hypothetical protein, putative [Bodo saltans]
MPGESLHLRFNKPILTPWEALEKGRAESQIPMIDASGRSGLVYVIAYEEDWRALENRHVDFSKVGWRPGLQYSRHFDVAEASTTCSDPETIILIGGESGSGKTMHVITGNRAEADVVVCVRCVPSYFRGAPDKSGTDDPRASRNEWFMSGLVALVKLAMDNGNPMLDYQLKKWGVGNAVNKPVFKVRVCLDEMGAWTSLVLACCAASPADLRKRLGWGAGVELRIIAGGTGLGRCSESFGSESSCFQYSNFSGRGINIYWRMRDSLDGLLDTKYTDLRDARTKLSTVTWANVEERKDALQNRDEVIQATIKRASNENAVSREQDEWRDAVHNEEEHESRWDTALPLRMKP